MNKATLAFLAGVGLLALVAFGEFFRLSYSQEDPKKRLFSVSRIRIIDGDTIEVSLDNEMFLHSIRLAGINVPESSGKEGDQEPCQAIGERAKDRLREILHLATPSEEETVSSRSSRSDLRIWVELGSTGDEHVPYYTDKFDRLLGFVKVSSRAEPAQVQLVREGLARLDVRPSELKSQTNPDKFAFEDVFRAEVNQIINSQIEAAKAREGWWIACDPFRDSALAVAAIHFWEDEQVVYIVNRSDDPIPLDDLALSDRGGNVLRFRDCVQDRRNRHGSDKEPGDAGEVILQGEQTLKVKVKASKANRDLCMFYQDGITWIVKPKRGDFVWNQSAEEKNREVACLLVISDNIEDKCKANAVKAEDEAQKNLICYAYQYPPDDGQTPSYKLAEDCPRL